MRLEQVHLFLESTDGASSSTLASLQEFSPWDRFRRAGTVLVVSIIFAACLIPIPIIHLLGIPLVLLIGLVVSGRQLGITCRLRPVSVPCPRCAGVNRLGGGLGMRNAAGPFERSCEVCRRSLSLRIDRG